MSFSFLRQLKGRNVWATYGVLIAWLVMVVVFSLSNENFITSGNWINILRQTSITAIAAIGATIILISGGIDISQGAIIALSGIVAITGLESFRLSVWVVMALCIGIGALVGLLNGLLAEKVHIPAFIATLGMMLMIRGIAYIYTGGESIGLSSDIGVQGDILKAVGRGFVGPVPIPVILMLALYAITYVVVKETAWGIHTYAVGSDVKAAKLAGIRTSRHRIQVYVIAGAFSALAGVILAGRLTSAAPGAATGIEFDIITAVVLGGTSIYGGRGNLLRTLLGAVFLTTLYNGMLLLNIPSFYQMAMQGAVLLAALALDQLRGDRS